VHSANAKQVAIDRFARVCGFAPDANKQAAVAAFEATLRSLSPAARKLLAHVADLATRSHSAIRRENAAYMPELHETCGLDPDAMYGLLKELENAGSVRIEGEYPFQDVVPTAGGDWPLIVDLARYCAAEKLPLKDVIVDLKFELLR
jgi:predicted transcriptional regulator